VALLDDYEEPEEIVDGDGVEDAEAVEGYGDDSYGDNWLLRRQKILKLIPTDPTVLINVSFDVMPSTSELTALGRKATKALVRGMLDNADDSVRALCVSALSVIRDPEGAQAFIEALSDRNASVRSSAARALGALAEPKHGEVLWRLVENPEEDNFVKVAAIDAIGAIGYSKAVPKMLKLLKSDDSNNLVPSLMNSLWRMRNKASKGDLIEAFLYVLKGNKWGVERVVEYLGELKADEAAGTLASFYVGKPDALKNRVILAMGKIGGSKARDFLKGVVGSTQVARHLNNAAIALAAQGERKLAIDLLAKLMTDRKAYLRINAAFALGEIGAGEAVAEAALVKGLDDQNDLVRSEAAVALGRIKATSAVGALEKLAESKNPYVKLDAVIALNRIDYKKYKKLIVEKLLTVDKRRHGRVVERGIRFMAEQKDADALPHLLSFLRAGTDVAGTLELLQAYPQGEVKGFESVIGYLAHRADGPRFAALLRVLRSWSDSSYAKALLERLYHTRPWSGDRELIYYALGRMNVKEIMGPLGEFRESRDAAWLYQLFAVANLGHAAALDKLIETLQTSVLERQRDAAFLLGSLDSDVAVPKLREIMAKSDAVTAVSAAYALAGRGDAAAIGYLFDVVKSGTPVVVDEAARALLVTQSPKVDEVLGQRVAKESDLVTKRRVEEILYQRRPKDFR
jgi:HEAT repeat protein